MTSQVQIDALNPQWSSSLALGVTEAPPGRAPLPACAHGLKRPAWLLQRRAVFHGARKIRDLPGPSLEQLPAGTVLGLLVDVSGRLHLFINGRDQGAVAGGVPSPCYVLLDLYGQCQQVTIVAEGPEGGGGPSGDPRNRGDVEKADVVDGVKESLCWGPPAPPQPCPYHALCARFKDLLLLPDEYFAPEPRRSRCFCEGCERGGDPRDPRDPRDPPLPLGWCRFSLRPKARPEGGAWQKWPRAYHGTSAGSVRRSLDRGELVPGPWSLLSAPCRQESSGPAHSRTGPAPPGSGPRPPGPAPLVLSPALGYAAMENFASRVTFREPGWPRPRGAQVAFEVWVRPGSFRVGPPSLSPPPSLEPPQGLDPAQLEWVTKEPGATVLAGLLVRVD